LQGNWERLKWRNQPNNQCLRPLSRMSEPCSIWRVILESVVLAMANAMGVFRWIYVSRRNALSQDSVRSTKFFVMP